MTDRSVTIRPLQDEENDLRQVVEIENLSFSADDAYTPADFRRWLGYNPEFCLVAEIDGRIVGDMICRILRYKLDLASCAIHPDYRRCGIGSLCCAKWKHWPRSLASGKSNCRCEKPIQAVLLSGKKWGLKNPAYCPIFTPMVKMACR
jgi:Acetyltransferases